MDVNSEPRLTIRLDGDLKDRLHRLGEANNLPASWFVRKFVAEGLGRIERGEDPLFTGYVTHDQPGAEASDTQ